jgi:hypothetical protein
MRPGVRTWVGLLVGAAGGAAATLAGCNVIVSAGDYKVGDGDGGSQASPDTGGSTTPESGTTPPAETGGPVVCGQGLPTSSDFQLLVKTCVTVVSCNPFFFETNISKCISQDYLDSSPSLACLKNVATCDDFYNCWGTGLATLADCPNTGAAASCDANNRAINCTDQATGIVRNCAKLGGMCQTYLDTTSTLTADCVVDPACTDLDTDDHCFNNNDYVCNGGRGYGESCDAIDSVCTTVNGSSGCFFKNPACSTPGYSCSSVNGQSTLAWCTDGKQAFDLSCARSGLSCATDDDAGTGDCVAPGCTLDTVAACTEACGSDGKTISICIGGAPVTIDCSQYGFSTCNQSVDSSGTTYAFCQK